MLQVVVVVPGTPPELRTMGDALKSERSAARDREHWPRETTSSRERVSRFRLVGKILKPPTLPSIRRREVSLSRGRY